MKCFALLKNKLKIGFRLFPFMLVVSAILLISLILVYGVVSELISSEDTSSKEHKMVMAVSGDFENTLLSSAVGAISLMDYSKYSFSIKSMEGELAREKLKKGEITAWVHIPEGFVEAFEVGEAPMKLVYTYSDAASNLGKMLTSDVLSTASGYITIAHSTIFNFMDFMEENGHYSQTVVDNFMEDEVFAIVSRGSAFDIRRIEGDNTGDLTLMVLCGLLVLFFLLMGTISIQAFGERNRAVEKRLHINGIGAVKQSLIDFFVLFLVEELLIIGDGLLLFLINTYTPLFGENDLESIVFLKIVFFSIPVVLFMAAMQLFIYELMGSGIGGVMTNFFVAIFIGFLSGCLYPVKFFPDILQEAAKVTPVGMSVQYICDIFEENTGKGYLLYILLYALFFWSLSVFVRKKKLYDSH